MALRATAWLSAVRLTGAPFGSLTKLFTALLMSPGFTFSATKGTSGKVGSEWHYFAQLWQQKDLILDLIILF